jgi:glycosyltransferase involved in cell wall biosynthesis
MRKIQVLEMIDQPFLGGGQVALLALAKNLDKEKFEVSVCSREGGPLVDELKKINVPHFPASFTRKISRRTVSDISSILRTNGIDLLHTHGGIAGFYGRWAGCKSQTPVIVHTLHGIHYLHYRNFFLKWIYILLERYFSKFTDALIFVSEADYLKAKKLRFAPEAKMRVIKNGIDLSTYKSLGVADKKRKELGIEESQPIVGTVARLHRQKGIIYLLRAARKIHHHFPEAKILVAGGGPLEQKFGGTAQKLGVNQYFWILGERTDALELLSLFDVFVLPSLWEGLPFVLIEAAALGKPIVATDVDGIKEVVEDGKTGILVPPGNPKKLAEAIISLLKDKADASELGKKAQKLIPPRFPLSRMVEETQKLYLELYQSK